MTVVGRGSHEQRWKIGDEGEKSSGGADRISGTRGVSVQWRALDTFRRLENICPRGDQKPPFVLPSGAKIKRHSRGPAHSPARESRERQRIRGGNEPPQKKRRWMLRILGSTAINHRANSPFDFLFSLPSPLLSHRNCSFSSFPFLKRDPFFVGSVLRSELLPFSRQWNLAPPSGRRRTRERFEIDSSFRKIEGRGGEERERASNNLVQHFHCRAIAFS